MRIEKATITASLKRSVESGTAQQQQEVNRIIDKVKVAGDAALYSFTEKFDSVQLAEFRVTEAEIERAFRSLDSDMINILEEAAQNIYNFHEKQTSQSWFTTDDEGTLLGQKVTPLDSVGVYVPGGTAAYPSSVLMNVMPAKVAKVERIVMVSPPKKDGNIPAGVLAAAKIAGVHEIYKLGGAHAIAALAYGTESIQPVDKIVGPGNIYVALAKKSVFGMVDIDMIAGPSEIVVVADESGEAAQIAADLLSQAEHDERASAILVTSSESLAENVKTELEKQLATLPRKEIAEKALEHHGRIYVTRDSIESIQIVNKLAPEHVEVITKNAFETAMQIRHAGAIFIGPYSSEPIGDYFAGPNHVLPTNGTARFSSPLSVDDFVKKSSIIQYSEAALKQNGKKIASFARLEGLEAHARAVEIRNLK
ncbi:histidinol dehydrogenase [Bacillus sp. 2205SS5-2]|uniref:histidinol dehydrogenase n=1 Tax=Bacillus sp. 2205SS5-2 TaxID=3109031 RepID=UPI003004D2F8